jgi:hypothetical protein
MAYLDTDSKLGLVIIRPEKSRGKLTKTKEAPTPGLYLASIPAWFSSETGISSISLQKVKFGGQRKPSLALHFESPEHSNTLPIITPPTAFYKDCLAFVAKLVKVSNLKENPEMKSSAEKIYTRSEYGLWSPLIGAKFYPHRHRPNVGNDLDEIRELATLIPYSQKVQEVLG